MKGGLEKWLATNNAQKPEEVQFLGTKPKLMSKAAAAAKRAAKKPNPEAKTMAAAAKTTAASRKTKISFADKQKDKTWKYKLVISWTILVKYKENSTTKDIIGTALGKSSITSRRQQPGAKVTQPSNHNRLHPEKQ